MQTLHISADEYVIEQLLKSIETFSKEGRQVELLDDKTFILEKYMIDHAKDQLAKGEGIDAQKVWSELLDER
jgi:hypothetical protein